MTLSSLIVMVKEVDKMFLTLIDITPARARVKAPNEPSCHSNVIGWVIESLEPCEGSGFGPVQMRHMKAVILEAWRRT